MDDLAILSFISTYFIVLCVGVYFITLIFRTLIETILDNPNVPASKDSFFWRDFVLPVLPIVVGLLFCIFATNYPYPAGFSSFWARLLIGSSAGGLSSTIYRIVIATIKSKYPLAFSDTQNQQAIKPQAAIETNKEVK